MLPPMATTTAQILMPVAILIMSADGDWKVRTEWMPVIMEAPNTTPKATMKSWAIFTNN